MRLFIAAAALLLSLPALADAGSNTCAASCFATEAKAPAPEASLSKERKRIIAAAESFLHKVSDCGGTGGEKLGAEVLEKIYKDSLQGLYSAATMRAHLRKANAGQWSGPWSWGGLFSVAVLRQAGFTEVSWGTGKMIGRKPTWGHKGVQAGDIAVWDGSQQHTVIEKIEGDTVYSIEGQQECGAILRKKRSLAKISAFYAGPSERGNGGSVVTTPTQTQTPAQTPAQTHTQTPAHTPAPTPVHNTQIAACNYCYANEVTTAPTLNAGLSKERRHVIEAAASYLHQVSDCGSSGGEKFGADVLEKIYVDALQGGWNAGLMRSNVRKVNAGKWSGPWSWCGIYAVAAVRKAGFSEVHWGVGKLEGRKPVWGNKGVKPGDVAFWTGGLNHHDIVEKIEGETVWTIDGNQECGGIMRKKRKLSNMGGYYNIAND